MGVALRITGACCAIAYVILSAWRLPEFILVGSKGRLRMLSAGLSVVVFGLAELDALSQSAPVTAYTVIVPAALVAALLSLLLPDRPRPRAPDREEP